MLMTDDNFCIPGSLYKQIEVLETCFLHLMFQNMVDRIYIAALYDTVSHLWRELLWCYTQPDHIYVHMQDSSLRPQRQLIIKGYNAYRHAFQPIIFLPQKL